jgi:peptidoglycan hydrolase CwlO-like protein
MKFPLRFFLYRFISLLVLTALLTPIHFIHGQMAPNSAADQAKLQAEYDSLQKEIVQWQGVLDDTRKKAGTIQGDITVLTAKIKEAELTIKAKNIAITQLASQISTKTQRINELEGQITKGKQSLAQLMRKTNELDSFSLVDVVLANRNISDFFQDLDSFTSIKKAMKDHFIVVRDAESKTQTEKEQLDIKKNQTTDAKYVVETQKKAVTQNQTEQKKLLALTKQQEQAYQVVLADRQKKAAQIRAALFHLRDTEGIPFSQALAYANVASGKTGVRPALILAILTQESDLGANQGSCILSSLDTGDGVGKNTGSIFQKIMKAPRDTVPFQTITARLGLDWKIQPVSCPPGATYSSTRGYGGGMGPSQFIPSTWELFKARIGAMVGVSADSADPWDPQHAFVATGIYMSDLGAVNGSYTAERNAACKYYSGASCKPGRKPSNVFYGDQVMKSAETIQANIDFLKGV